MSSFKNKIFLSFVLTLLAFNMRAQVHKYWMGDTANVFVSYDTVLNPMADTMAFVKGHDTCDYYIYWDKEYKHVYCSVIRSNRKGNDTNWYRNGKVEAVYYKTYFPGQKYPRQDNKAWYDDGSKKLEPVYVDNKRFIRIYYHSGKLKATETEIAVPDTSYPFTYSWVYTQHWCENGNVLYSDSVSFRTPHKIIRTHCNGVKEAELTLVDTHAWGKYILWYDNGQVKQDGQFDSIEKWQANHKFISHEQGKWSYYDRNGKLTMEEFYKDGVLIDTKKY